MLFVFLGVLYGSIKAENKTFKHNKNTYVGAQFTIVLPLDTTTI
jgi:hypothetical protein